MDASKIKIDRIQQFEQLGPGNTTTQMLRVTFSVDNHGPFTEMISKADFDAAKLNTMLQAFANKLALLGGV